MSKLTFSSNAASLLIEVLPVAIQILSFTREVISRLDEIVSEVEVADIPDANGQKGYVYKDAIELYQKIIKRLNK